MLAFPRVEDRHAFYGRVRLQRNRVDCVVGADNKRDVCVWEVIVDFIHFEDDCRIQIRII